MSITSIFNIGMSGLSAAQKGMSVASDNIANVNTPGYARKRMDQTSLVTDGQGSGVQIRGVNRVVDQYLQKASLGASADTGRWEALSDYLDRAQGLFGDPSGAGYFFGRLDDTFNVFAAAADDPSSGLLRSQAISGVQDFLSDAGRIDQQLSELSTTVDSRIQSDVARANDLLKQIDKLNTDISRAKVVNGDATGSENLQSQLVDELSTLMSVQVSPRDQGGVVLRTAEGVTLAGDGPATLSFVGSQTTGGYIAVQSALGGLSRPTDIASGELRGLLDLRDRELPALSDQLGEFVSRAAEQINAAHNASTSTPAPTSLTGRNTGLDLPTAVGGFSGKTTIAIVDQAGVVQRRVDVDFDAGTMTVDGAAGPTFNSGSFLASLNTALTGFGSAGFANGALSIAASGTGGVAIADDATDPSSKAGKGFSHFFGLNDLIRADGPSTYDTGLTAGDPHGFAAGDEITFSLASASGQPLRQVTVAVPAGGSMADLLTALNAPTGVGAYGQFALDSRGALTFTGAPPANAQLSVANDGTSRGAGGPSISQLFGLGTAREGRADRFSVDPAIAADPRKLAFAQLDLTVAPGDSSLRIGDGRGALALAGAGETTANFAAAGDLGAVAMTLSRYATEFGAAVGNASASADAQRVSATAVQGEADQRRASVEGVNMDEELVALTTYQQAYNASARLIQAAKDMYDVLLDMV